MTTEQLVDRAKGGDAAAYEQLLERVAPRLLTFVELRLGRALREKLEPFDIVQDALLEAHRSFDRFEPRGEGAFLRWLYRIVDHRILDQADRFGSQKRSAARLESSPAILDQLRGTLTGPSTKAARAEERGLLTQAMDLLDDKERRLLLLHHFQGESADEIATALGQSGRHVRRLLRTAEAALGREVERLRGRSPDDPRAAPAQAGAELLTKFSRDAAPPPLAVPGRIGPYVVRGELGRGAVGIVVRAVDPASGEEVAVKLLGTTHQDARRRFVRETRALTKLSHAGIVAVRDVGEHEGAPFLVMDLVEGEDLQTRLRRDGPLPVGTAVSLALTLAGALEHAHERGVLHRDVKPHNVLLRPDGGCVLTDFSLAKLADADLSQLSERGQQLGTEGYWPPEQAKGALHLIGPASDVYGLGATLHAMLTGRPPFEGATAVARVRATLRDRPPAPSTLRPGVPAALDLVCARCLEKDPRSRFPTAAAVAEALALVETA